MWVILWRITTGLEGKKPNQLTSLGLKRLAIAIGESLSVNQRWPHYQEKHRSARDAVQHHRAARCSNWRKIYKPQRRPWLARAIAQKLDIF